MNATQVTYAADMENNATDWWDAFRETFPPLLETDPELHAACATLCDEAQITLHDPKLIERFDALVTGLPGWEDGPAHAKTALVATAE